MDNSIAAERASAAFDRAVRRGRSDTGLAARLRRQDNRLLLLSQVASRVQTGSETYLGPREIPVARIIGSEDRGDDFSRSFYPRRRWMRTRWQTVYRLLQAQELNEAIRVMEIGGYYFVRDGHHRVSAARSLGVEFLPAVVTRLSLDYQLPCSLDRNRLALLCAKERFHRRTGVFHVLPDSRFSVACPETWELLEREITDYNLSYFRRHFGRDPYSLDEQIEYWYENLYRNSISYIQRNSLSYLFPGMYDTDIFVRMIQLWNSYENPDGIWLGEVYTKFISRYRRRNLLRSGLQMVRSRWGHTFMSSEDEYRMFLQISRVPEFIPDFEPLPQEAGCYMFLYRQLISTAALLLKRELDRAPYMQELVLAWHERFYREAAAAARRQTSARAKVSWYKRFSRRWFCRVFHGSVTVQQALDGS
ncbi:ParB/RepB/Spo0J family partition protein [Spirochaeta africana]|uniref:ParB-like nuclease n=1 Tax=Spirochaeta africana (strain ATCC 700263 / DSM 8902 / Z-7692) TaxID=889378 RepID=H9UJV1_SPIAZ|nr:ParB/RepB/Spo0J family partition protein [Spirochaeta africana]AFG37794.1 ParB-like nuclease [Spirochaeta africana DSM 8902]